jgi:hypothetical protein
VLHALGASKEDVMADYLLTNERLKPGSLPSGRAASGAAGIPAGLV